MNRNGYDRNVKTPDGYLQQPDGRATLYNQTYIGYVKDNKDDLRMGRLKVWIPELGGDPDSDKSWYTVNYCSPFAGATPIDEPSNTLPLSSGNKKDGKKWLETQRSYGFWAVPPDVDNEVIVMFINGDPNKGIWIGCLYKQYMNHMVPGIPRNYTFDPPDDEDALPPVAEYNKWSNIGNDDDPLRAVYEPLADGLKMQGLEKDPQRGPSSSGARRESPSKVFGMLTPRGSQFVMDDYECNEFIRLRTRTGVQLLIHETEGYVYMNSKKGNSWIQISDDGVDIYSSKGVNIRSQNGYNFHTDKDYNLHIGGNFNVFCEGDMKWSTKGNADMLVGKDRKEDIGGSSHSLIKKDRTIKIEGGDNTDIQRNATYRSGEVLTMQGGKMIVKKAPKITQNNPDPAKEPDPNTKAEGPQPEKKQDRKLQEKYPEDKRESITARMPTHEPFDEHPGKQNQSSGGGGGGSAGGSDDPMAPSAYGNSGGGSGNSGMPGMPSPGGSTPGGGGGGATPGNSNSSTPTPSSSAPTPGSVESLNPNDKVSTLGAQEQNMDKNVGLVVAGNSAGTGVLIDNSGNMLTNSHVVGMDAKPGQKVMVDIGGEQREAVIVSNDSGKDLAQIRLTDASGLTPVSRASGLNPGDKIYSYGYGSGSLTKVEAEYTGENGKSTVYQGAGGDLDGRRVTGLSVMRTTNTNGIIPGMSGGPVFNSQGQLVGINAATTPGTNRAKFIPV